MDGHGGQPDSLNLNLNLILILATTDTLEERAKKPVSQVLARLTCLSQKNYTRFKQIDATYPPKNQSGKRKLLER